MPTTKNGQKILNWESYRLLVDLVKHEEQMLWSRTQLFFILNSAFVAILGYGGSQKLDGLLTTPALFKLVCFYGVFTSVLWPVLLKRTVDFYDHWVEQLKFLESTYPVPIKTFQLADEYFVKGRITLGGHTFEMGRFAKLLRIHQILTLIPLVFLVMWLLMFVIKSK